MLATCFNNFLVIFCEEHYTFLQLLRKCHVAMDPLSWSVG